jgi:hypothetical protein
MASQTPALDLIRLVNGYQISQAIHVAATLAIADHLAAGERTSDDLAAATGTHAPTLYRLMRALAAAGVFHEGSDKQFALTPMGECLRSDAPVPVAPWATLIGLPFEWNPWAHLLHSVRTGENAFRYVHGSGNFDYLSRHPEEQAIFDGAMSAISRRLSPAVLAAYDFSLLRRVVDVGGGTGTLLADILAAHPHLRGVLFDQPHVVERARLVLEAAGVADRCEIVGGSFFESVPEGGDAYLLKFIVHDWDDAASKAILRACRRAMGPEAKLLVLERLVGPPNEGADTKFTDLIMLVEPGGLERTPAEFESLFTAVGLRLARVVPTTTALNVIEGVPMDGGAAKG